MECKHTFFFTYTDCVMENIFNDKLTIIRLERVATPSFIPLRFTTVISDKSVWYKYKTQPFTQSTSQCISIKAFTNRATIIEVCTSLYFTEQNHGHRVVTWLKRIFLITGNIWKFIYSASDLYAYPKRNGKVNKQASEPSLKKPKKIARFQNMEMKTLVMDGSSSVSSFFSFFLGDVKS